MRKEIFTNDNIYHIYNRGVEKRQIFMDSHDHFRFIHDLFEFNDIAPAGKYSEAKPPKVKRELLVEILSFCLMPNHFHLILRQVVDNGITTFMHKLGTGYTRYFNDKGERVGSLFQSTFKAKIVENDQYLLQLSKYIHLNPLELFDSEFKKKNTISSEHIKFLDNYRWSSYMDYIGNKNFPSVTHRNFILDISGGKQKYQQFITDLNSPKIDFEL